MSSLGLALTIKAMAIVTSMLSKSSAETSKTDETVSKMSDLETSGETWPGHPRNLKTEEAPQNNGF